MSAKQAGSSKARLRSLKFKFGGQCSGILYHIVTRKQIRIFYPDRPPAGDCPVGVGDASDLAYFVANGFPWKEIVLHQVQARRPKRPKV